LRAVDKMERAVEAAGRLVRPGGWMALMTTEAELEKLHSASGAEFSWSSVIPQPGGDGQLIALGVREINLPA